MARRRSCITEPEAELIGEQTRLMNSTNLPFSWTGFSAVPSGGTLVLSRPELTTRVDRDFTNYGDSDLLPPFGWLPPPGNEREYVEKRHGKGRYFLFTAHSFPGATDAGRAAYRDLVARLAAEVRQSVRLIPENDDNRRICYGVYPQTVYFLNTDTVKPRTFTYELDGRKRQITLAPCEIRTVKR